MTKLLPALFAEICITVLGVVGLEHGLNGAIFAGCIAALAGLGGYSVKQAKSPEGK